MNNQPLCPCSELDWDESIYHLEHHPDCTEIDFANDHLETHPPIKMPSQEELNQMALRKLQEVAIPFTGSSSYIKIADSLEGLMDAKSISAEFWIHPLQAPEVSDTYTITNTYVTAYCCNLTQQGVLNSSNLEMRCSKCNRVIVRK